MSQEEKDIKENNMNTHILGITSFSALTKTQRRKFSSTPDNADIMFALCSAHFTQESVCARQKNTTQRKTHLCWELNTGLLRTSNFTALGFMFTLSSQ
jgi:hypothetical protein